MGCTKEGKYEDEDSKMYLNAYVGDYNIGV